MARVRDQALFRRFGIWKFPLPAGVQLRTLANGLTQQPT